VLAPKEDRLNANRMDAARSLWSDLRSGNFSALPTTDLLLTLLGVIYLISPIDFIPEVALGPLGLLDDTGVLALIMVKLTMMLDRRAADLNATDPATSTAGSAKPTVVQGEVIR
jgi:uncharacterized membrane protein YkvA (DUF1232 family)